MLFEEGERGPADIGEREREVRPVREPTPAETLASAGLEEGYRGAQQGWREGHSVVRSARWRCRPERVAVGGEGGVAAGLVATRERCGVEGKGVARVDVKKNCEKKKVTRNRAVTAWCQREGLGAGAGDGRDEEDHTRNIGPWI